VPVAFAIFLAMCQEIRDANTHSQLQDDLVEHFVDAQRKQRLVLFVIHLFEFYFDFKLLFVCMNNNLNNLYGSGGCISCRLTAALFLAASAQRRGGNAFFKKIDRIYNKMSCVGLLGRRLGARLGNLRPAYRN
jgi:hypothetical protein